MKNIPYTNLVKLMLEREEGRRSRPYSDTRGHLTIGIGRNLLSPGLRENEIDYLFYNDLEDATKRCEAIFPGFRNIEPPRQMALLQMSFQLGNKFTGFHKLIGKVKDKDWDGAGQEAFQSDWAMQTPQRAARVITMLKKNVYPY